MKEGRERRAASDTLHARTGARRAAAIAALVLVAIAATGGAKKPKTSSINPRTMRAVPQDSMIRGGEKRFAHLWQITFGGENAEGYFSGDGSQLIFQSTQGGWPCDQMFVMDLRTGVTRKISSGGRTTCGYFLEGDRRILYASTHLAWDSCPPPPDYSKGYVWAIYPGYDLFTANPDGSDLRRLTETPGYDAEATVSVDSRSIVFTSVRDGDLELYTMRPDGGGVRRLTHEPGYDGGAFFSRDGKWICWRRDELSDSKKLATYRALLRENLVRPSEMHLWVMRADGSGKKRVTHQPGASFAPYFTPDGKSLIYSSNWENPKGRNFDLYVVGTGGGEPAAVTRDPSFDGFPMFSPDGRWLVFASNRGAKARGETNLFLAEWKP